MFPELFKLIPNCGSLTRKKMFYLTLAISCLYVLLTALKELEELNVDRTVITDEGCTVLPSKLLFYNFELFFYKVCREVYSH